MDSLTQVALGGAVGYAVLGSKVGRKAILWGAVLGTLPDLDVFLPYAGEVEAFTYHRGFSHSLLVHLLISPVITWLILRIHTQTQQYRKEWFYLVFLCLSTHALLDSFNVYGTQLMWPLTEYPFGVSNLFIIDPLYTLPLLIGLLFALLPKIRPSTAKRMNTLGIVISSIYIAWSLGAKVLIDRKVEIAFQQRNIDAIQYVSTPAPFSTLLWRIVVMTNNQYYEGYASVFDAPEDIGLTPYQTRPELLETVNKERAIMRLQWFTKGFYSVSQRDNKIVLSDLRMGIECGYVFNFIVAEETENSLQLALVEKFSERPDLGKIGNIWDRIWDPTIKLSPIKRENECL
jgi:inner membrane protein